MLCHNLAHLQIFEVQVSLVLVGGLVSTMAVTDDWVKEILENLIAFLITSNTANSHDEGVTWRKSCTNQNADMTRAMPSTLKLESQWNLMVTLFKMFLQLWRYCM